MQMTTIRCLVVMLVIATAASGCSTSGTTSQTSSPAAARSGESPTPSAPTAKPTAPAAPGIFGVAVDGLVAGVPSRQYQVLIFDSNGTVVARVGAATRAIQTGTATLPETSQSATRAYFLDGDVTVRYLMPDGGTAVAGKIPSPGAGWTPDLQAAFAVSPDDKRIAIAMVGQDGSHLFVQDLNGDNRVGLYDGPIVEWPVGWHQQQLVLQVGDLRVPGYGSQGEYHVVNAATGNRLSTVCETGLVYGVPTMAGTLCSKGKSPTKGLFRLAWDATGPAVVGSCGNVENFGAALRGDGNQWATSLCGSGFGYEVNGHYVNGPDWGGGQVPYGTLVLPEGWMGGHCLVYGDGTSIGLIDVGPRDTDPNPFFCPQVPRIGDHSIFVGTVPTQLQ